MADVATSKKSGGKNDAEFLIEKVEVEAVILSATSQNDRGGSSSSLNLARFFPDNYPVDNEIVMAYYTVVQRMMYLIGDITFGDLGQQLFSDLAPTLAKKIEASPSIVKDPKGALQCLENMVNIAGALSFLDYVYLPNNHPTVTKLYTDVQMGLWNEGIYLPFQIHCGTIGCPRHTKHNKQRRHALEDLVRFAGTYRYMDCFPLSNRKLLPYPNTKNELELAENDAINGAVEDSLSTGIIMALQNGECCDGTTGKCVTTQDSQDYCIKQGCLPGGGITGITNCSN